MATLNFFLLRCDLSESHLAVYVYICIVINFLTPSKEHFTVLSVNITSVQIVMTKLRNKRNGDSNWKKIFKRERDRGTDLVVRTSFYYDIFSIYKR